MSKPGTDATDNPWHPFRSQRERDVAMAMMSQARHYDDGFGYVDLGMIARACEIDMDELKRMQKRLDAMRLWSWRGKHPDPPSFTPSPRQIREACAEIQKEWTARDWEERAKRRPMPWLIPMTRGVEYRKGVAS